MWTIFFVIPFLMTGIVEWAFGDNKKMAQWLKSSGFWLNALLCTLFSLVLQMILFMSFGSFLSFSWLKLLALTICSLGFHGIRLGIRSVRRSHSAWSMLLLACIVAVFLEGTVFNFRFYQSYEYEPVNFSDQYYLSKSLVATDERENEYTITGTKHYIDLYDMDTEIHNIYLDLTTRNSYDRIVNAYVDVYLTDESNENYLKVPAQTVMSEVESTKYLYLMTNGNTEDLRFGLTTSYGETYQINGIYVNVPQSFQLNWARMLAVALLLFSFWFLRPSSPFYRYVFGNSGKQKIMTACVIVIEIALLLTITFLNPIFSGNPSRHTAQYQQLAEAFLDGQLYLSEEPPEFLANMENPYDATERSQQSSAHGQSYYWDAAYFDGHYYVYFGVVPVLLLYLPFRLLTGQAMANIIAIQVFLSLFVVGAFLFIGQLLRAYFRKNRIPYLSYLILCLIFVNASGAVFIAKRPDFYSVPIISALAFTMFGLYFWLKSKAQEGKICPIYAGMGSLCMALVAGCRPQLLLVSAMAVVFFWNSVFHDRSLFSKKGWRSTVAICLPYLLVAAGIMWYNDARFGSVFDFGANYNLTTNDMTGRGYRVERVGLSIFTYFFQLPNLTAAFPFLQSSTIHTNYLGTTITEPMFGGIFAVIPLLWILFLLPSRGAQLKRKRLLALCLLPLGLSFFIGAFDAQGAGLLQRYVSDFAFLACLSALIMIFFVYEGTLGAERKRLHSFMRFSLFVSGAYCFMLIFAKYSVEIFYRNPYLFNLISETVQFW
ncbi:MAG: hypothetical protein IJY47_03635 [Clostridia bacterium]|nr:hypothetical protein [Clostridia bacterium]